MRRTIIQVVESLLKVKPYYTCKKGLPLLHSDFFASVIFYISDNLEEYILSGKDISSNEKIAKHEEWVKELLEKYPDINAENIHAILQKEVGLVFVHVLEESGVYKCTPKGREDFMRCVESL